jgi:hypothetical protein
MEATVAVGFSAEPMAMPAGETGPARLAQHHRPDLTPGHGTFFDEFVGIREPEKGPFLELALASFDAVRPRKRKRKLANQATHTERISGLIANAMRAHFFRNPPSVLYLRKADAEPYRHSPSWMRHGALGEAVDALGDAGLLTSIIGKEMPHGSEKRSHAASYAPTDHLVAMALECGVTSQSIVRRIPAEHLVRLREAKPEAEFDWINCELVQPRKGNRIIFEPTPETNGWTTTLAAINAFYRQQDISLALTKKQMGLWRSKRHADPARTGVPFRLPETFGTDLYRVFNNGEKDNPSFSQGGRMFGGWWMYIPKELREAITINGQPTVELDYANCHPRLLYAERGLDFDGDLYELPEIADASRPLIKWVMQVLLNGKRRPSEAELPDDLAVPQGFTLKQITAAVEARHQPIADAFKRGVGLRLMRLESDIALEILTRATAEGWVALSIQDSFITTASTVDRLKGLMIQVYLQKVGRNPVLKE